MADNVGRLVVVESTPVRIKATRPDVRSENCWTRARRRLSLVFARIRGRYLKLRRRISRKKQDTQQPLPEIEVTFFIKRRRHILVRPSLSVIFEKKSERMVNEKRDDGTHSSVSLETLLSSFSSIEYWSSSDESVGGIQRSEKGREERILSSRIKPTDPETEDVDHNKNLDFSDEDGLSEQINKVENPEKPLEQAVGKAERKKPVSSLEIHNVLNGEQSNMLEAMPNSDLVVGSRLTPIINVIPADECKDFSGVVNISQNANPGSDPNGREEKLNRPTPKSRGAGEAEPKQAPSRTARQRVTKRVHFDEQHLSVVINESISDSAVCSTDGQDQALPMESASFTENTSLKDIQASAASFVSDILSKSLFSSRSSATQAESNTRFYACDSPIAIGGYHDLLRARSESVRNLSRCSSMSSFPYNVYIDMVTAEKSAIQRECGSHYDHGDTFKARDLVDQRGTQNLLLRLQNLRDLLKRARDNDSGPEEGVNKSWMRQYLQGKETQCKKQFAASEGPKETDGHESTGQMHRANLSFKWTGESNMSPIPKSGVIHTTTEASLSKNKYEKGTSAFDNVASIPDALFWKNLNQGKIKDASKYVKDQQCRADDMSTWKAHSMCEMFDDDLWELYAAAEETADDWAKERDKLGNCRKEDEKTVDDLSFFKKCPGTGECFQARNTKVSEGVNSQVSNREGENTASIKKHHPEKNIGVVDRETQKTVQKTEQSKQKSKSKLPGFLQSPLGSRDQMKGRRHSNEDENLRFFKYVSKNPGFFRSGTPVPPKEGETSGYTSNGENDHRDYSIDSETAVDNLFFFRSVSRSSQFYIKSSSLSASKDLDSSKRAN